MLEVNHLSIEYSHVPTVKDVSFTVGSGEIFSIIGKSGSGKSTILNAISSMLGNNAKITSGDIMFQGMPLLEQGKYTPYLKKVRGRSLAMIMQHPDRSLDPVFRIGYQMTEVMRVNEKISKEAAKQKGLSLLSDLKFEDPERVWRAYPHELSGGMCQRVAIAMALSNEAKLLLADEPTSALDVTIQAELVAQLKEIARENNLSILLVTHNMDVAEVLSDRIAVMEEGRLYLQ